MIQVIIVDDEYSIREGMKVLIDWEKAGAQIVGEAADGAEALELLKREPIQLAVTDIRMPVLGGLELVRTAREAGLSTQFIIISGYDDFKYAQCALEYDVFRYLLKPVDPNELFELVREMNRYIEQKNKEESIINKYRTLLGDTIFEKMHKEQSDNSRRINGRIIVNSVLVKVIRYIAEHLSEELSLEILAKAAYINPSYLSQLFKRETGINFVDYLMAVRVERAKELLLTKDIRLYEVAQMVGYNDVRYFSKMFKRLTGQSPPEYRSMANGGKPAANKL
jgi:two-component system response regulator YesN